MVYYLYDPERPGPTQTILEFHNKSGTGITHRIDKFRFVVSMRGSKYIVDFKTGGKRQLLKGADINIVDVDKGVVYFESGQKLYSVAEGKPETLLFPRLVQKYSASITTPTGLYVMTTDNKREVWEIPKDRSKPNRKLATIEEALWGDWSIKAQISEDGKHLALGGIERKNLGEDGTWDLAVIDLEQGGIRLWERGISAMPGGGMVWHAVFEWVDNVTINYLSWDLKGLGEAVFGGTNLNIKTKERTKGESPGKLIAENEKEAEGDFEYQSASGRYFFADTKTHFVDVKRDSNMKDRQFSISDDGHWAAWLRNSPNGPHHLMLADGLNKKISIINKKGSAYPTWLPPASLRP